MRRDMWIAAGVTVFVTVAFALTAARDHASAQGLPPAPVTYSGTATAGGAPVPDGYVITARIGDYLSQPIVVKDGYYVGLQVAAPTTAHVGRDITFLIGDEPASETDVYRPLGHPIFKRNFNLTFGRLPAITPTPTATAIPTPESGGPPAGPPTQPPGSGIPNPSTYSGRLSAAGAEIPAGMELVARVGSYASEPALIRGDSYSGLVVNPADASFVGREIEFFLGGIRSATTATFRGGEFIENFTLVFFGFRRRRPRRPQPRRHQRECRRRLCLQRLCPRRLCRRRLCHLRPCRRRLCRLRPCRRLQCRPRPCRPRPCHPRPYRPRLCRPRWYRRRQCRPPLCRRHPRHRGQNRLQPPAAETGFSLTEVVVVAVVVVLLLGVPVALVLFIVGRRQGWWEQL